MQADQDLIPKGLRAERLSIERGSATIPVAPVRPSAGCPICGRPSQRVHRASTSAPLPTCPGTGMTQPQTPISNRLHRI